MGGTQPTSINDRSRIVGLAYDAQGGSRGFQLQRGEFTQIDAAPDAVFTRPLDINNQGRIVGDYGTDASSSRSDVADRREAAPRFLDRLGGLNLRRAWLP
jgi:hypothetical protein